jgi:ribosome-binding protein aMBF1 (putative translation factor)
MAAALIQSRVAEGNTRMRGARRAKGYSQRDLASLVPCPEWVITKLETGRPCGDEEAKTRIAEVLGMPRFELFDSARRSA